MALLVKSNVLTPLLWRLDTPGLAALRHRLRQDLLGRRRAQRATQVEEWQAGVTSMHEKIFLACHPFLMCSLISGSIIRFSAGRHTLGAVIQRFRGN